MDNQKRGFYNYAIVVFMVEVKYDIYKDIRRFRDR